MHFHQPKFLLAALLCLFLSACQNPMTLNQPVGSPAKTVAIEDLVPLIPEAQAEYQALLKAIDPSISIKDEAFTLEANKIKEAMVLKYGPNWDVYVDPTELASRTMIGGYNFGSLSGFSTFIRCYKEWKSWNDFGVHILFGKMSGRNFLNVTPVCSKYYYVPWTPETGFQHDAMEDWLYSSSTTYSQFMYQLNVDEIELILADDTNTTVAWGQASQRQSSAIRTAINSFYLEITGNPIAEYTSNGISYDGSIFEAHVSVHWRSYRYHDNMVVTQYPSAVAAPVLTIKNPNPSRGYTAVTRINPTTFEITANPYSGYTFKNITCGNQTITQKPYIVTIESDSVATVNFVSILEPRAVSLEEKTLNLYPPRYLRPDSIITRYAFTNTTITPLTIKRLTYTPSPYFTLPNFSETILYPGRSYTFDVVFKASNAGQYSLPIEFETDQLATPIKYNISADVLYPNFITNSYKYDFGNWDREALAKVANPAKQLFVQNNNSGDFRMFRFNLDQTLNYQGFIGGNGVGNRWDYADIFGDGRDVYATHWDYGKINATRLNGNGTTINYSWSATHGIADRWAFAKIFGDNRDLYVTHRSNGEIYATQLNSDSTRKNYQWIGTHGIADRWAFADIFGDGIEQYVTHRNNGQIYATALRKDGTFTNRMWNGGHGIADQWHFAKIFDNKQDIYITHRNDGQFYATRLNTNGTVTNWHWTGGAKEPGTYADIFGDGKMYYVSVASNGLVTITEFFANGTLRNYYYKTDLIGCSSVNAGNVYGFTSSSLIYKRNNLIKVTDFFR